MSLIEVTDLSRTFEVRRKVSRFRREVHEVRAVDHLSFAVEAGEMVGYIGPNGAGKSTTIKMLTGILVPSSGSLSVAGIDPSRNRVELTRRIGVVFGQRTTLWWDLPLRDSFELLRRIYRIDRDRYRRNLAEFTESCSSSATCSTPRSGSCRWASGCAATSRRPCCTTPEILYLDEPTIGLDVVSKGRLREFLRTLNAERGVTLLLTTHDLQDIEQLCSRVMVIDHGSLVFDGSLELLHERGGSTRTLVVDLVDEAPPIDVRGRRCARWRARGSGCRSRPRRARPPWWRRSRRRTTWRTCPSPSPRSRT